MPADATPGRSKLSVRTDLRAEAQETGAQQSISLTVATVAISTFAISISALLGVRPVSDPSPWLHLKVGAYLLDGGRFGLPDPWAPFAIKPYLPTEWLPAVIGQEIFQAFGLPGIAWMRCAGILGLLSALVWAARRSAETVIAVPVSMAALVGASDGLTERPQLLGFIFLAVAVGAWWRSAMDLRPRWWLVPMTWFWACCHGLWSVGIAVGLVITIGLLLDRRLTRKTAARFLAILLLCVAAAGLTPIGPRLILTPLSVGSNVSRFVGEWQPTSIHNPLAVVTLAMLGLVVLAWIRLRRQPQWWQICLLLTGVAATLATFRTIAVGAVIAAPLLAQEIQLYRGRPVAATTRRSRAAWGTLVLAALVAAAPLSATRAQEPEGVPQGLKPQLSLIRQGTVVLAQGDISGWLYWTHPGVKPVLDQRIEIHPEEHVRGFVSAMAARPGWTQFVDSTRAQYALVLSDSAIATALAERAGWTQIGKDAGFVLLRAG